MGAPLQISKNNYTIAYKSVNSNCSAARADISNHHTEFYA